MTDTTEARALAAAAHGDLRAVGRSAGGRGGSAMTEQQTLDLAAFGAGRSAVISGDGLYRYRLDRRWSPGFTGAG